jgi:hypothetical protein
MKFSGFIHFGPLKPNSLFVFREKIAGARENSANFDFLSKTAHFQIFFLKYFSNCPIWVLNINLFVKTCAFRVIHLNFDFFEISRKLGWCIFFFKKKKSDAQVGRVNTFHILQTIRKRPSTFRFCMEGPLRFPNF